MAILAILPAVPAPCNLLLLFSQIVSIKLRIKDTMGGVPPRQFSGYDSVFPLQEVQIQSLVQELKTHQPCGMAKKIRHSGKYFIKEACHLCLIPSASPLAHK